MKKNLLLFLLSSLLTYTVFSQINFSDETKKYIEYNDSITVFKNALLIDGKGNEPKPHQTVILIKGLINWVGDDNKAIVSKKANTVELNGKALMPGLVMLHEHMYISAFSITPLYLNLKQLPFTFPRLYLAAGATTIRTCGSIEPYSDIRIKKDIDEGVFPGPSIQLTGPYIEGKNAIFPQMKENKTPGGAAAFVNYWADQGFTSFKAYMDVDQPTLKAAIEAAHKRNLKITGHLCGVTYREAAELGIDNLEHGFLASSDFVDNKIVNECPDEQLTSIAHAGIESEKVKGLLQFLVEKKVAITSTLAVFEDLNPAHPAPLPEVLDAMSGDTRDSYLRILERERSGKSNPAFDDVYNNATKMEKQFYKMGGLLVVGTDPTGDGGTLAGYGNWRAIELLVEADGFTPLQAIKIATLNGAIALGSDKTIGTIEPGKIADLLIIDGDPSKNISDIRKMLYVFKNGVGYNSKKLFDSVKGRVGLY